MLWYDLHAQALVKASHYRHSGSLPLHRSLHYNITEAMLRGIFEPFGAIDSINLLKDPDTGLSRGYGFLTFTKSDDAKRAIEQLNGFEIAGRPMKVANVTEKAGAETGGNEYNKLDDIDTKGVNMGASGEGGFSS